METKKPNQDYFTSTIEKLGGNDFVEKLKLSQVKDLAFKLLTLENETQDITTTPTDQSNIPIHRRINTSRYSLSNIAESLAEIDFDSVLKILNYRPNRNIIIGIKNYIWNKHIKTYQEYDDSNDNYETRKNKLDYELKQLNCMSHLFRKHIWEIASNKKIMSIAHYAEEYSMLFSIYLNKNEPCIIEKYAEPVSIYNKKQYWTKEDALNSYEYFLKKHIRPILKKVIAQNDNNLSSRAVDFAAGCAVSELEKQAQDTKLYQKKLYQIITPSLISFTWMAEEEAENFECENKVVFEWPNELKNSIKNNDYFSTKVITTIFDPSQAKDSKIAQQIIATEFEKISKFY